jgi:hypothetical protein
MFIAAILNAKITFTRDLAYARSALCTRRLKWADFAHQPTTALPSSEETVEGTEIPSWVAAAGRTLFERSAELANSDYPLYTGARTQTYTGGSNLTDAERQGMGILTSGAENYMPYMNKASDIAGTLGRGYDAMTRDELMGDPYQGATREELMGNPFSLESAQPFMDIYQSAMDPAVRQIQDQTLQAQNEARAKASRGGAGFGSRLGIVESQTTGEGARAAGDLRAGAAKEGLNFAAGRYDQDRQARFGAEDVMYGRYGDERAARFGAQEAMRTGFETEEASRIAQMNAYQNMAPLISDLQNQAAAGLISVGEAQRQLDQRALDLAYADYIDQKEAPYEQLNFAMGALSGTPYNKVNRGYNMSTTMAANPSVYAQTISGLGSLGSAYGAYKNSNK